MADSVAQTGAAMERGQRPVSSTPERDTSKRKRDAEDSGRGPSHQRQKSMTSAQQIQGLASTSASGIINYLPRQNVRRLSLLPGDSDTFTDVVTLISDYEAVMDRQDSLAASLGAKLTGPRLLKGVERIFDGPIKTNSSQPFAETISWTDVVLFSQSNPQDFVLTPLPNGARCCRFICKGLQVEITEDDWRLISSGALDRLPLERPFEEDEAAELATLDILEQRATMLCKKAEEVAARARMIHDKFQHRRQDITRRRQSQEGTPGGSRFQPMNQQQRAGSISQGYDLHADLLQQFVAASAALSESRSTSGAGVSVTSAGGGHTSPVNAPQHHYSLSGQSALSARSSGPLPHEASILVEPIDVFRSLITQKVERLLRGDTIVPACDRCRRLKLQCVKHLTACQGCTKKHAKCTWKNVTEDEAARLRQEMGVGTESDHIVSAGTDPDVAAPRSSLFGRTELTPGPPIVEMDRPQSRGDMLMAGLLSPKTIPPPTTRADSVGEGDPRRTSLPHTSLPHGLGPPFGPGTIQLEIPREPSRLSQIALASVSASATPSTDTTPAFGSILNPSPR